MSAMNNYYFDGSHLKNFNLPMSWDSDFGWEVLGEPLEDNELVARVAAVSRAFELNALAAANMPFALVDDAGNEFDVSTNWQNKVGFMPNPRKLMRLWRKSISVTNSAYALLDKKSGLRYVMPNTIKPDVDSERGLIGFWRQVGGKRIYFPVGRELIHIFRLDYDTEIIPSENTELKNILSSAGLIYYTDIFVEAFFRRGGIKPHLLFVKGVMQKEERERVENIFTKIISGAYRYLGKVWNAEAAQALPIGEGIENFKDNKFYRQALENIAMATGIPLSLLLSNSANLATARMEYKSWYDNSVIPMCQLIADELNDNLFSRFGLKMDIRDKETDPDQEEEVRRSAAFVNYANTLMQNKHPKALSLAAQLVGLDLPPDMDYDDLDEREEEPEEEQIQSPRPLAQIADDEDVPQDDFKAFVPTADQLKELKNWMDIAERKIKRGEGVPSWDVKYLPANVAGIIQERLQSVTDVAGVRAAFDLTTITATQPPAYKSEIVALAEAINKLAENYSRSDDNG